MILEKTHLTLAGSELSISTADDALFTVIHEKYLSEPAPGEMQSFGKRVLRDAGVKGQRHSLSIALRDFVRRLEVRSGISGYPEIHEVVREFVQCKFSSARDFSHAVGISQAQVSNLMNGKRNVSLKAINEMAGVLELRLALVPRAEPNVDRALRGLIRSLNTEVLELTTYLDYFKRSPVGTRVRRVRKKTNELFPGLWDGVLREVLKLAEEEQEEAVVAETERLLGSRSRELLTLRSVLARVMEG